MRTVPTLPAVGLAALLALTACLSPGTVLTAPGSTPTAPALRPVLAWRPVSGATFNQPLGTRAQRNRIQALVNRTIDAAPRRSVIRAAVFSFSQKSTADALLRARARGVAVRMIFDDHTIYPQEARLRRLIGGNPSARSFVLYCSHACRGTTGDMHEGTRRLVLDLREKYPKVACVGEMPYDALHGFIPMYHAGGGPRWQKYSRFDQHLSAPAPGRGSSGVHESGFGHFNPDTLNLSPNAIPTLQVVDDTFAKHRSTTG